MSHKENFTDDEKNWDAVDLTAWFGLDTAFEANREFGATGGNSERYLRLVDWAGKVIGPGSLGEKSLYLTEPGLANIRFAPTQD